MAFIVPKRRVPWAMLAVAATALVGTAFTGCSATTAAETEGGVTELAFYSDNPAWRDGFVQAGEVIAESTGYSFKPTDVPTTESYTQTILASLPTKKTGDIVKWWSGRMLQGLAATGQVEDLTEVWDAAVAAGQLDDALRPLYSYEGKVYGVPFSVSHWVTFYSKTAFEKAGIAETPKTWDELEADVAKLHDAGYQFCTGIGEGWTPFIAFQMFLGARAPEFYDDLTSGKADFDDPVVEDVLDEWKQWIDNGWTTPADTKPYADCPAAMKAGTVAMMPSGTWANGMFGSAGLTADEYGAFLTPSMVDGETPGLFMDASALVVPKNAPHKEGAIKALAAWLDAPAQEVWSDFIGEASTNPNVVTTDPVIKSIAEQIEAGEWVKLNRYYEALPPKLVQSSIATLSGFMVDTSTLDRTISDLKEQAETEWAAWEENPSIG